MFNENKLMAQLSQSLKMAHFKNAQLIRGEMLGKSSKATTPNVLDLSLKTSTASLQHKRSRTAAGCERFMKKKLQTTHNEPLETVKVNDFLGLDNRGSSAYSHLRTSFKKVSKQDDSLSRTHAKIDFS
jgi:hypothetical protein